jgi:hypothetical protein
VPEILLIETRLWQLSQNKSKRRRAGELNFSLFNIREPALSFLPVHGQMRFLTLREEPTRIGSGRMSNVFRNIGSFNFSRASRSVSLLLNVPGFLVRFFTPSSIVDAACA